MILDFMFRRVTLQQPRGSEVHGSLNADDAAKVRSEFPPVNRMEPRGRT